MAGTSMSRGGGRQQVPSPQHLRQYTLKIFAMRFGNAFFEGSAFLALLLFLSGVLGETLHLHHRETIVQQLGRSRAGPGLAVSFPISGRRRGSRDPSALRTRDAELATSGPRPS